MWPIASYAGTGMAIAGIGATYYALTRRDHELELRNHAEMLNALSGVSNHPDVVDSDFLNNNTSYANLFGSGESTRGQQIVPGPSTLTVSQTFMKANLKVLARENGGTEGLNIACEKLGPEVKTEDSGTEFDLRRIVSRSETDPAIYQCRSSKLNLEEEFEMGSKSENFGYFRQRIPPEKPKPIAEPLPRAEPVAVQMEPEPSTSAIVSGSSRSVFGVETCSQFQLYSEDDIPSGQNNNLDNLSQQATLGNGRSRTLTKRPKDMHAQGTPSGQPIPISSSVSEHKQKKFGRNSKQPKLITSNIKYALKSARQSVAGGVSDTSTTNPYLTRAEPINFLLQHPKHFKEPRSCSTTEKFRRERKAKREHFRAVRRCDTEKFGDEAYKFSEVSSKMFENEETFENTEKDSIEFLLSPSVPLSNLSVRDKSCTKTANPTCVSAFVNNILEESHQDLENPSHSDNFEQEDVAANDSVSETTFTNQFIRTDEVGSGSRRSSSSTFDFGVDPSSSSSHQFRGQGHQFDEPFQVNFAQNVGPGLEIRGSGMVYDIPGDSWMMYPLRLLPGDMIPWGLLFFAPFVLIFIGFVSYIFVSLTEVISAIFGGPSADITDSQLD